jgi:hypothetical protein
MSKEEKKDGALSDCLFSSLAQSLFVRPWRPLTAPPCGMPACSPCPAGTYGATPALTSAACSGNCTAGYYCVAGSTSTTDASCPAGKYSLVSASMCTSCSAGLHGDTVGLTTAACTGLCSAGTYGAVSGLATSSCSGPCAAGIFCVAGSTTLLSISSAYHPSL